MDENKNKRIVYVVTGIMAAVVVLFGVAAYLISRNSKPAIPKTPVTEEITDIAGQEEQDNIEEMVQEVTEEDIDMTENVLDRPYSDDLAGCVSKLNNELLYQMDRSENLLYSPYGIYSALMLAANGASGDTAQQYSKSLGYPDLNSVNNEFAAYIERLKNKDYTLANTSLIQVNKELPFTEYFEKTKNVYETQYDSDVITFDKTPEGIEEAKARITEYVDNHTNGFIPDYKPIMDDQTDIDLLNVVYFLGTWSSKFDESRTKSERFCGLNEDVNTPMMNQSVFAHVVSGQGLDILSLPFKGGDINAYIIKTSSEERTDLVDELYLASDFDGAFDALETYESAYDIVNVKLPRITFDKTNEGLKDILTSRGYGFMFEKGHYDKLISTPARVSNIANRSKISLKEDKAEAASATEMTMTKSYATSVRQPEEIKEIDFFADQPFIVLIRDRSTGVILFTGLINDIDESMKQ